MTRVLPTLALALACVATTPAAAQIAISRAPATSPVLGNVVQGSAATTFGVSTAGVVTRASGDAIRVTSSATTPTTITITCPSNANSCKSRDVRVTIAPSGAGTDASVTLFRVGTLTGATYRTSAPADAASLTFDLRPLGAQGSASFPLGMNVLLSAAAGNGTKSFSFTVTATFL